MSLASQLEYEKKLNDALRAQLSPKAVPACGMTPPPFTKGEEKMGSSGVTIRELEAEPGETISAGLQASINTAQVMAQFNQEVQVATGQAVDRAFTYADKLSRDLMEQVKLQLAGINRPRVMVVEIDKVRNNLKNPATAYLSRLLINAKLGLNTLLVGPAGCGKTIAAGQVAEALGKTFGHVCLTAGASETWLFGRQTPNGFVEAPFSRLFREGGVFLLDELDAADPNLLLSVNTALANGHLFNPISGLEFSKHPEFVCIAAANTVGKGSDGVYTGRARLDGASLTRFVKIKVDYCEEIEARVCPDDSLRSQLQAARKKLREMKSQEIISTRCISNAYAQKMSGVSLAEILDSLTLGWPEELPAQVGLVAGAETKRKSKRSSADASDDKEVF